MGHRIKIGPMVVQDGVGHGTTWMLEHLGVEIELTPVRDLNLRSVVDREKNPDCLMEMKTLAFPEGSEWVRHPKESDRRKSRRDAKGSILVRAHGNRYLCTFTERHLETPPCFGTITKAGGTDD